MFLSNGPGDPEPLRTQIGNVQRLIGKVPIFGICLGNQILGLAVGGKTYKMKFGHRGANHPVLNKLTNKVEITSHNHGFAVDPDSLNASETEITHVNLNDQALEGSGCEIILSSVSNTIPKRLPGRTIRGTFSTIL